MIKSIEHQPKIEKQVKKDVRKENKFLGSGKVRKGLGIYGINPDTRVIYEVELDVKRTLDLTKNSEHGTHRAFLNPNHQYEWALNRKNTERKLLKKLKL